MTNGDKIRQMGDEGLAELITMFWATCACVGFTMTSVTTIRVAAIAG